MEQGWMPPRGIDVSNLRGPVRRIWDPLGNCDVMGRFVLHDFNVRGVKGYVPG